MNRSTPAVCPICLTQKEGEVVLIGIVGTQEDNLIEAAQFHLECINLLYDKDHSLVYQILPKTDFTPT